MIRHLNKLLAVLDLKLSRAGQDRNWVPRELRAKYWEDFGMVKERIRCRVFKNFKHETGPHPMPFQDFECSFAAKHIVSLDNGTSILDVGSYRNFVLGIQTGRKITTLDIRERKPVTENEIVYTGDVRGIDFPDESFDCVVSLCSLEHFGLGRYGDVFDPRADRKAIGEMARMLKSHGLLIISTTIHRGPMTIAFNAHRIYDYLAISEMRGNMVLVEEQMFSKVRGKPCDLSELTDSPFHWDIYCGAWRKV